MFLGDLLIQKGLLTQAQLGEALADQAKSHDFLGAILVRKGFVKELELIQVLSEQLNIPFLELKNQTIDWEVALRFPPGLVVDHQFLPIRWDSKGVTVAVINPMDAHAIGQVESVAQFEKVHLALVTASEMQWAVKIYKEKMAEKIKKMFGK